MIKKITLFLIGLFIGSYTTAQNIETLIVPENFEISILTKDLDSPRQITETKDGAIIVGSKKGTEVIAFVDEDNDGLFNQRLVANNLQNPAGVVYFQDDLYFAEMDTIWIIENMIIEVFTSIKFFISIIRILYCKLALIKNKVYF